LFLCRLIDSSTSGLPKKRNSRNPRNPVTVTKSTVLLAKSTHLLQNPPLHGQN